MDGLISVIVPIYNVENYLVRCIDSIINQTYSNLEIILVDDGSPDNCHIICDEYAKKDSRIKVIHKKNGGLSDARNAGLEIATGKYISFIDSDDYIYKDMYTDLIGLIKAHDADISNCSVYKFYENDKFNLDYDKEFNIKIYSNEDALRSLIMEEEIKQTVWNKIYKRKIIDDIKFEVGKIQEDEYWTYKVIGNAKKVVHIDKPMYYYLQRENSIMGERYSEKRLHGIYSRKERLNYIQQKFPNLIIDAKMSLFFTCVYQYQCLLRSSDLINKVEISKIINFYIKNISFDKKDIKTLNIKQKIWFYIAKISLDKCCKIRNYLKVGL